MAHPSTTRDIMIDWMRDAHAMERANVDNMETQISHLDHYPDLRDRYRVQADLSKQQQQKLSDSLQKMGAKTSAIKEAGTRFAGKLQAWGAGMSRDEVVKQAVSTLAFQNFEIANFRALASAAEREGEAEMKAMFEEMAREKEDMAQWLSGHIPDITQRYLDHAVSGAKH